MGWFETEKKTMTRTYSDSFGMKVDHIKRLLNEHPGLMIHSERRTGKTEALIQFIREQHAGLAIVVCPSAQSAELFLLRYQERYPMEVLPTVVGPTRIHDLQGRSLPIFVDEWPSLSERAKSELRAMGVAGSVGTIEGPSAISM